MHGRPLTTPERVCTSSGYVTNSVFLWVLVFVIILYFLPFSVFLSYSSFLYFSHFSNFVSFTFNSISILIISHFIFLLNISVLFSLCARLNWQFVCQFLSANLWLYCIALYVEGSVNEMIKQFCSRLSPYSIQNNMHAPDIRLRTDCWQLIPG